MEDNVNINFTPAEYEIGDIVLQMYRCAVYQTSAASNCWRIVVGINTLSVITVKTSAAKVGSLSGSPMLISVY